MRSSFRTLFFFLPLAIPIAAVNCGGGAETNGFTAGPPSGNGGSGGNGGNAGVGGGRPGDASAGSIITGIGDAASGKIILGDGEVCAGEVATAQAIPLDMFIMLDQSTSMTTLLPGAMPAQTRWQAVTTAIINFVNAPQSGSLSVGIQYFGQLAPGTSGGASTCDVAAYSTADVEIGSLSDPTVVSNLTASIMRHAPSTFTPTAPAVAGAIAHAKTWAAAHPDRPTIVVLATDGFPSECPPTDPVVIASDIVAPAAAAPADASNNSRIRTFVIAAGNEGFAGLNSIAQAGGTGSPFVVVDGATSAQQITDALIQISHTNLACSYAIPIPDGGLDPSLVNVRITPSGQAPVLLDLLKPGTICTSAGGFFYDSPTAPTHLTLCPSTCDSLVTGQIEIVVGCPRRGPN